MNIWMSIAVPIFVLVLASVGIAFWKALVRIAATLYFWRAPLLLSGLLSLLFFLRNFSLFSGLYFLNQEPAFWFSDAFWVSLMFTLLSAQIMVQLRLLQKHGSARLGTADGQAEIGFGDTGDWSAALLVSFTPLALNLYQIWKVQNGSGGNMLAGVSVGALIFAGALFLENAATVPNSAVIIELAFVHSVKPVPDGTPQQKGAALLSCIGRYVGKGPIWLIEKLKDSGDGFLEPQKDHKPRVLLSGHLLSLLLWLGALLVYVGGFAFQHSQWGPGHVKAILYVLVILCLYGGVLGLLCFWLDRFRIPVITIIICWTLLISSLPRNLHYYPVLKMNGNPAPQSKAGDLFAGNERVIVISAEGGGIHATGWTTQVLCGIYAGLNRDEQPDFLKSIRLLSGVSGGSTGLMFFQTLYRDEGPDANAAQVENVCKAGVADDALSWVGFGIAYFDLTRPIFPLFAYPERDRGWALETGWGRIMERVLGLPAIPTMRGLRRGVDSAKRPLLLWNATIADSGHALAIANFDMTGDEQIHPFDKLYRERDISLVTAVRLSATFPYVSPSPRPFDENDGPYTKDAFAVSDGGYFDNYGVAGAARVLVEAVTDPRANGRRLLWIQIRSSSAGEMKEKVIATSAGGPLSTLYDVRDTGQRARMRQLTELVKATNQIQKILKDVTVTDFEYPMPDTPLSWVLNPQQKSNIACAWDRADKACDPKTCDPKLPAPNYGEQMKTIRDFLKPR
jgi:hypothetical protein